MIESATFKANPLMYLVVKPLLLRARLAHGKIVTPALFSIPAHSGTIAIRSH